MSQSLAELSSRCSTLYHCIKQCLSRQYCGTGQLTQLSLVPLGFFFTSYAFFLTLNLTRHPIDMAKC